MIPPLIPPSLGMGSMCGLGPASSGVSPQASAAAYRSAPSPGGHQADFEP